MLSLLGLNTNWLEELVFIVTTCFAWATTAARWGVCPAATAPDDQLRVRNSVAAMTAIRAPGMNMSLRIATPDMCCCSPVFRLTIRPHVTMSRALLRSPASDHCGGARSTHLSSSYEAGSIS